MSKVFQCSGCGRTAEDPVSDLLLLTSGGHISCCPDRKMVEVAAPFSPPAQKPGLELGGSLPGLVGTPKPGSLVTLKDGRTLKVQRISKRGVLTLCHTCGGFAAYSHVSAVVAV